MRMSRRAMMAGCAGALAVSGFDPRSRTWVTSASALGDGRSSRRVVPIPRLAGTITTEGPELDEAGRDFGNLRSALPWAVLRPGDRADVVRMVRYCHRVGIKVAVRGQAHSVFGQAQAEGGLVIDSRTLSTIGPVEAEHAWVETGVVWRDFLAATSAQGRACPVLTDYLGLSIGGVLSVGGVGGASHQHGLVADQALELEVVTGDGRWLRCSPRRRPSLFRAVLGGLGQYALILAAKIRLAPQPPFARIYQLTYDSLGGYLADQRLLNADERFDFLEGQVVPGPEGGFQFVLQGGCWFDPATPPDDAALTADLSPMPGAVQIDDLPFEVWSNRVDQVQAALTPIGLWDDSPHPWSDLFLPDDAVHDFVSSTLAGLGPEDVGAGLQLLYPFKRDRVRSTMVSLPATETVWLYDILRFPPPDPALGEALVARNRELFDAATAAGGKRYPISAVPMAPQDWARHYGANYPRVVLRKARYDRRNTLTPGQSIFRR